MIEQTHPDEGARAEGQNPHVGTHRGLRIYRDLENGTYYAANGGDFATDGADTLAEAKAQIDAYWDGTEHGPLNGFHS